MSCFEAGHILSNGRKITIFCFSSAAMSVKSEIPAKIEFSQFFEDNTCAQLATPVFSTTVYLVLIANFNSYQFTNSHYPPDYSQYGDRLFSPFSLQMCSQDLQPSTSQPSFDRAFATCGLTLFRSWLKVALRTRSCCLKKPSGIRWSL